MRLIDSDAKISELRGKLCKYAAMEQTPEVQLVISLIRRCIAELSATEEYAGGAVERIVRNEEIVRCPVCRFSELTESGELLCRNPYGLLEIKAGSFCSEGVRK